MRRLLITCIALMLLLTGCGGEGGKGSGEGSGPAKATGSFIGGDKGLEMEFFPGAPPQEVYDQNFPFSINLKIVNNGEYDIEDPRDATVTIVGIDPADFSTTSNALRQDVPEPMRGKHLDPQGGIIEGTTSTIDFAELQYAGQVTGTQSFVIRANICYKYGTLAVSKLCILEDMLGTTRRRAETPFCNPNTDQKVENSGAPVQIKSLKQTVTGRDKLSFQFTIFHKGGKNEKVSKVGSECSIKLSEQDVVYVKVDSGLSGLSCSGLKGGVTEGFVTLYGEKGSQERTIVCTQTLNPDRTDFEKPVRIELTYDYESYIQKENFQVKHIGS